MTYAEALAAGYTVGPITWPEGHIRMWHKDEDAIVKTQTKGKYKGMQYVDTYCSDPNHICRRYLVKK